MISSLKNSFRSSKDSLPIGSHHQPAPNWRRSFRKSSFQDGSAAGIHTTPTVQQAWQRASPPVKATWISMFCAICMVWFGWRWIRYNAAGIQLTCHSVTCELKVIPVGWRKKVTIDNLSRSQLQNAYAVKTDKRGNFVTDKNIALTELYDRNEKKKGKKKKSKSSSYKGPDENGHYLSYAIVLSDMKEGAQQKPRDPRQEYIKEAGVDNDAPQPEVDLRLLHPFMERYVTQDDESGDGGGDTLFRLIPRQFGVRQSKRRVRTMIQKIESYIKRRRQKLTVRENSPPSWQGVLLMVFGCIAVVLSAVLGQFQEEAAVRGPGVRRQHSQNHKNKQHTVADAFASATPARYEVSTTPATGQATAKVQKSGYRRNTTQVRKRPGM